MCTSRKFSCSSFLRRDLQVTRPSRPCIVAVNFAQPSTGETPVLHGDAPKKEKAGQILSILTRSTVIALLYAEKSAFSRFNIGAGIAAAGGVTLVVRVGGAHVAPVAAMLAHVSRSRNRS